MNHDNRPSLNRGWHVARSDATAQDSPTPAWSLDFFPLAVSRDATVTDLDSVLRENGYPDFTSDWIRAGATAASPPPPA